MLIIYQDVIMSVHGIFVLIGFMDRRLFCSSEDLTESYQNPASPFCTISGNVYVQIDAVVLQDLVSTCIV